MAVLGPTLGLTLGPLESHDDGELSIRIVGHGLLAGDGPIGVSTSVALPTPLVGAANYYAVPVDADHLQLATSRANALAGIYVEILDAGSGTHSLDAQTAIHADTETLTFAEDFDGTQFNDGWITFAGPQDLTYGDGPLRATTTGTLPDGLTAGTDYWIAVGTGRNSDYYPLATSFADAVAGTPTVAMNDAGTGTHTLTAQPGAAHYVYTTLNISNFTVV